MRIAVIGGGLQGLEASYLAKKAGWEVLLVDKNRTAPAIGLCDKFIQGDVRTIKDLDLIFDGIDIVIPALENDEVLTCLEEWKIRSRTQIPLAFDREAYGISSSKFNSNHLFARLDVPVPLPWPDSGFPVLVKPSSGSGSKDVKVFNGLDEMDEFIQSHKTDKWVMQAYLTGPSYSLEIIGVPGKYQTFQVTELEMDKRYDCKRVLAPAALEKDKKHDLEELTCKIAHAIHLKGMMDIEVIFHGNKLKVLEIDARLPSQTPIAVFHSTGVNMLRELAAVFLSQPAPGKDTESCDIKYVILEHIRVTRKQIYIEGEYIMKGHGTFLHVEEDFFGADEAITNYMEGLEEWVATLVISGNDFKDVHARRRTVIATLKDRFNIEKIVDTVP